MISNILAEIFLHDICISTVLPKALCKVPFALNWNCYSDALGCFRRKSKNKQQGR